VGGRAGARPGPAGGAQGTEVDRACAGVRPAPPALRRGAVAWGVLPVCVLAHTGFAHRGRDAARAAADRHHPPPSRRGYVGGVLVCVGSGA